MLGKKGVVELGKVPSLINALEGSEKITKFALDFENGIKEGEINNIMDILAKKHSINLFSFCFGKM